MSTRTPKRTLTKPEVYPPVTVIKDAPIKMSASTRALITQAGNLAATRLNELLGSDKFNKLRGSDQVAVINQALNRAFGTPENNSTPRGVNLNLTTNNADAVASVMRKLAMSELPERRNVVDITPVSPARGKE